MKKMSWLLAGRLLARDWRAGEVLVLFAALTVAVTAMSTVTYFTNRVSQAVVAQAGQSLAADLRLESGTPLSADVYRQARALGLATARVVDFLSVVRSGDKTALADVRAVSSGYPLRGSMRIADRLGGVPYVTSAVPARGDVWLEPALATRLGVTVTGRVHVGDLEQRVTHTLEFRPDQGWRLVQIAPTLLLNLDDLSGTGLIQPGSRIRYVALFAGDRAPLAEFRQWLMPQLKPGQRLEDLHDASPEVRHSVQRAERFLVLAALVSVLLGGVAVVMAARRFVQRRLDTVALMKCLGARHRYVVGLAVVQLLLLVGAAAALGSVLGIMAQLVLARLATGFLGTALPPANWAGGVLGPLAALVLALGFALPPLLQLGKVPPARVLRRDLAAPPVRLAGFYLAACAVVGVMLYFLFGDLQLLAYLVGGTAVVLGVLYVAGRVLVAALQHVRGRVGVSWRYGIANIARRGRESAVQIMAFGVGIMVLLLLTVVKGQLVSSWQTTLPAEAPNHFVINIQPGEQAKLDQILSTHGLPVPVLTPLVRARVTEINGKPVAEHPTPNPRGRQSLDREVNLSWAATLTAGNRIVEGHWWEEGQHDPQLSIEQERMRDLGLKLGDKVTFSIGGETLTFRISNARAVQWDSFKPNFFMVVSPGPIEEAAHTWITSFYLAPADRGVAVDIMRALPNVSVIDIGAVLAQLRTTMDRASLAVQYVFLFTLAAGVVVLFAAIQGTREERMLESAVLRTLGARRSMILQGVATEFVVLGLLSGLLAAAGAGAIGHVLGSRVFDLAYHPGPELWLTGLAAGALLVGVSGTLAVRGVLRASPVQTLRSLD